jgi:hypothetical protein
MVLPIVLAVFLAFAVAITWRPSVVIAMALCVYSFEQWALANSSFFALHSTAINLGFGLLTLEAVLVVISRGQNPFNPATLALGAWLVVYFWAGITCLWALDRETSFFLYRYYAPYNITFILLLPMVLQKPEDIRSGLVATLFFGTFVMALLLMGTSIHGWGRTIEVAHGQGVVNRVGKLETRLGPLAIAETCGQIMIVAVLMRFSGVNKLWAYGRWIVAFMALLLIYRSGSRGQLIAALMSLVMFMPMRSGIKQITGWIATMVSLCLIGGIAVFAFAGVEDQTGRWNLESMQSTFSSTRLDLVSKLMAFWANSPAFNWFFGIGSSASFDARVCGTYPHVVLVEILGELGFMGLFLYLTFIAIVVRDGIRLFSLQKEEPIQRAVAVTILAMFTYQMLLTFKQGSFITHTTSYAMCMLLSRQTAIVKIAQRKEKLLEMKKRWFAYYQAQAAALAASPSGVTAQSASSA